MTKKPKETHLLWKNNHIKNLSFVKILALFLHLRTINNTINSILAQICRVFRHIASSHMNPPKMVFFFYPKQRSARSPNESSADHNYRFINHVTEPFVWGKTCNQNRIVNFNKLHYDLWQPRLELKECKYYDPKYFKNLSKIDFGGFASVYVACWKNTSSKFAIKKFINSSTKEIINEVWYSLHEPCYCYWINYKSFYFFISRFV